MKNLKNRAEKSFYLDPENCETAEKSIKQLKTRKKARNFNRTF